MVEIKVYNDTKEKPQSFEAWIDGVDLERGYGANKEEAVAAYQVILTRYYMRLRVAQQDMQLGSFKIIRVNNMGRTI